MVPLGRALIERGHSVAFATAEEFCPYVEHAGFTAFRAGPGMVDQMKEARRRYPDFHPQANIFSAPNLAFTLTRIWAEIGSPPRLDDLEAIMHEWSPDLVVHDNREFAAPVAAAHANIPSVNHGVGTLLPLEMYELVGEAMAPLWEQRGMQAGPNGGMFRHLYIDICPPSVQGSYASRLTTTVSIGAIPVDTLVDTTIPESLRDLPEGRTVYISQGTTFNHDQETFRAFLDGLRDEDVNMVISVGALNDPAALGPQPPNVRVERYVPQSLFFPQCDLIVSHGGGGTSLTAMANGLPMLIIPKGGDQFITAERLCACGAARSVTKAELDPDMAAREVRTLLDDPSYRRSAGELSMEMKAMPSPDHVVDVLEELSA